MGALRDRPVLCLTGPVPYLKNPYLIGAHRCVARANRIDSMVRFG